MSLTGLKAVRDGLLSILYPLECALCGEQVDAWDNGPACGNCWDGPATLPLRGKALCEKCGAPGGNRADRRSVDCPECEKMAFRSARSCGLYSGAIEACVISLKRKPFLCARLRDLLIQTFAANRERFACDVIVPVPLHPARHRERGFNQSDVIAAVLKKRTGLEVAGDAVLRVRNTGRHRVGMDRVDRARSIAGAFEVMRPRRIEGRAVLLVDDVMTTGSTVSELANCLQSAGAVSVEVLTIARAPGRQMPRG